MLIRREFIGSLCFIGLVALQGCGAPIKPIPEEQVKQSEAAHAQIIEAERQKYQGGPQRAHGAK